MYTEKSYMEVFKELKANSCQFSAHSADYFLASLSFNGFEDWKTLHSNRELSEMLTDKRKGLKSSFDTGLLYYKEGDCYYSIGVVYDNDETDRYIVTVQYHPRWFREDDNGLIRSFLE